MAIAYGARSMATDTSTPVIPASRSREFADWPVRAPKPRAPTRDVALDLLRGLAMLILVVNHLGLDAWLSDATGAVLSAAETLVPISGVAVGMVFGRRWIQNGAEAVTRQLWARAQKIYVAAAVLGALVGLAQLVPGLVTEVATETRSGLPLYEFDGPLRTVLAVVVLEAGPWQTCILAFFVVTLLLAPVGLWALRAGHAWPLVGVSVGVYVLGRALDVDVLPTQSERPFGLLVWQVLFFPALAIGFHRERIAEALRPVRRPLGAVAVVVAVAAVALQLDLAPAGVLEWQAAHFDKAGLDPLRIIVMMSIAGGVYALLRRAGTRGERALGWLLLPLGRNSFYVFLVHVPLSVALATALTAAGAPEGFGPLINSLLLAGMVGVLVLMVRREVMFRWIPR